MSLNESAEISALLSESTLTGPSSTQLGWSGVAVERRTIQPCEKPELPIDHHSLILWLDQVSEGEIERKPGTFIPYKKFRSPLHRPSHSQGKTARRWGTEASPS